MEMDVVTKNKYEHIEQRIYWNGFNCSLSKLVCSLGSWKRERKRGIEKEGEKEGERICEVMILKEVLERNTI